MDDTSRLLLKSKIATRAADLRVLKKLPVGRLDALLDTAVPESFFDDDRVAKAWLLGSTLPRRRYRSSSPERAHARRSRELRRLPACIVDGQVFFKRRFLKKLIDAGDGWAGDAFAGGYDNVADFENCCIDLARAILEHAVGHVDWSEADMRLMVECAADHVHEGTLVACARRAKRDGGSG